MVRVSFLVLAGLLAVATAARVSPRVLQEAHDTLTNGPLSGLQNNFSGFLTSLLGRSRGRDDRKEKEEGAYVAIRFVVPPSESEDFEEAWRDLEEEAVKDEKGLEIFDLKKTKFDNLFYLSYGEWESMRDVREHIESDHFEKFAEFVDKRGIRWELQILENESEDVEEEQERYRKELSSTDSVGRRRKRDHGHGEQPEQDEQDDWHKYVPEDQRHYIPDQGDGGGYLTVGRKKDSRDEDEEKQTHVVFTYIVPPDAREDFESVWTDAAYKTVKEDGNRIYSLRKVASDNTRYYGYGTWDSMRDFADHFESKHIGRLVDSLADMDVVWFLTPLTKVGRQPE